MHWASRDAYIRIISGEAKGAAPACCRLLLSALSLLYLCAWALREAALGLGLIRASRVQARVISIGNITVGGTGKTPCVIYFARQFQRDGKRVAVISRGYGRRRPSSEPLIVSDAEGNVLVSPEASGDEPYLLAKKLPRIPVIVCADRVRAARLAVARFAPDVILLDDAFQHRRIQRDEDVVVIDCGRPFGYGRLLPRGLLREPLLSLKRATAFVLTHADEHKHWQVVEKLREINPSAEILLSRHRPARLKRMGYDNDAIPPGNVKGFNVVAVSSIGNPSSFEQTLGKLQVNLKSSLRFPDHHWYTPDEVAQICNEAHNQGADYVISTEKDGVRLGLLEKKLEKLLLLEVELEIIGQHPGP